MVRLGGVARDARRVCDWATHGNGTRGQPSPRTTNRTAGGRNRRSMRGVVASCRGQWKRISDGAGPRGAGHGRGAAPTDGRDSSLRPALQVHVGRLRQALRREGRPAVDRQRRRRVRQRALRRVSSRRSSANCSIGIASARRSRRGLAIFDFIEGLYNSRRRHAGLDYLSPRVFERSQATGNRTAPSGSTLAIRVPSRYPLGAGA